MTMSDTALPEPAALPVLSDAPPSSAGRSSPGPSGPVDQPRAATIPDELKERLDKVVYSEVSCHEIQLGDRATRTLC